MGGSKSRHSGRGMPEKVTNLHYAVMRNDIATVRALIDQGVDVNFPWKSPPDHLTAKDGNSPLLEAVSLNFTEVAKILLSADASVNQCDYLGCSPLYKAAFHGRPHLVDILVSAGGDVNIANCDGRTPLHVCIQNGGVHGLESRQALERLVLHGADVHQSDSHLGKAPIHTAAMLKLPAQMNFLLETSQACAFAVDYKGRNPVFWCASFLSSTLFKEDMKYQVPCLRLLFLAGADMLNLTEWIRWKGPGIPAGLVSTDDPFHVWYINQVNSPLSLQNLCRKKIQAIISHKGEIRVLAFDLVLPGELKEFVSRKTFTMTRYRTRPTSRKSRH